MAEKFTVQEQFEFYLKITKQDPDKMQENQYIETKRAFFAGVGQLLFLLRDEISVFPELMATQMVQKMLEETITFWNRQK